MLTAHWFVVKVIRLSILYRTAVATLIVILLWNSRATSVENTGRDKVLLTAFRVFEPCKWESLRLVLLVITWCRPRKRIHHLLLWLHLYPWPNSVENLSKANRQNKLVTESKEKKSLSRGIRIKKLLIVWQSFLSVTETAPSCLKDWLNQG